jgi:hypothetical protein
MTDSEMYYYSPRLNSDNVTIVGEPPVVVNTNIIRNDILAYMDTIKVRKSFSSRKKVPFFQCENEVILLIKLNGTKIIGSEFLGMGTATEVSFNPKEFYHELNKKVKGVRADKFIIAHNHPTDVYKPSMNDCVITKQICSMALTNDMKFLDHIIVGPMTRLVRHAWTNYYYFCNQEKNLMQQYSEEVFNFYNRV